MASPDAPAVALGLASAAAWGAGDFAGGLAARRTSVFRVVAFSQALGLALLLALALALRDPLPPHADLGWGAAAGLAGGVGVTALYAALARGQMGVAAPVTGVLAAIVPVALAVATEGSPGPVAYAGFALALAGVALVSRPEGVSTPRAVLLLAVLAGLGFGGFLTLIDRTSGASILWPLVSARAASTGMVALVLASRRRAARAAGRPPWRLLALTGVLDTGGNAFFVLAAAAGRLDVAAVLSSLYPAATVLLARVVLRERLAWPQLVGLALALAGVVLIVR